jgi:hypothetical protein
VDMRPRLSHAVAENLGCVRSGTEFD